MVRMYLLHLASAAATCRGELGAIDVLGLSMGHCALMSCCAHPPEALHINLESRFRYFMAAGGCIWQRPNPNIATEIARGLDEMSEKRGSRRRRGRRRSEEEEVLGLCMACGCARHCANFGAHCGLFCHGFG